MNIEILRFQRVRTTLNYKHIDELILHIFTNCIILKVYIYNLKKKPPKICAKGVRFKM